MATGKIVIGDQLDALLGTALGYLETYLSNKDIDPRASESLSGQVIVEGVFEGGLTVALNGIEALGVNYTTNDELVATMDSHGRITGTGGGITYFEVSFGDASYEGEISVLIPSNLTETTELVSLTAPDVFSANDFELPVSAQVAGSANLAGIGVHFTLEGDSGEIRFMGFGVTDATGLASTVLRGFAPAGSGTLTANLEDAKGNIISQIEKSITIEAGSAFRITVSADPAFTTVGEAVNIHVMVKDAAGNAVQDTVTLTTDASDATFDLSASPPTVTFPTSGVYEIKASAGEVSDVVRIAVRQSPDDLLITDISPTDGAPGIGVYISGVGFSDVAAENAVYFNGIPAQVLELLNGTVIYVAVPDGATTRSVTVVRDGRTSNALTFYVNSAIAPRAPTEEDIAAAFMLGEIQIIYKSRRISRTEMESINSQYGFVGQRGCLMTGGYYMAYLASGATVSQTRAIVDQLRQDPRVLLAKPHTLYRPAAPQKIDDPGMVKQNHLHLSNISLGLDTIFPNRGKGTTIAVIDSGVNPSLQLNVPPEFTSLVRLKMVAAEGFFGPDDLLGGTWEDHGTVVATLAAAAANGEKGIGVAPEAAVVSIRVFNKPQGSACTHDDVNDAIKWATLSMVDVINMSLGWDFRTTPDGWRKYWEDRLFWQQKYDRIEKGYSTFPVIVVAAGNERNELGLLPFVNSVACDPRVIAVGALDIDALKDEKKTSLWETENTPKMWHYSSYGVELDFVAPGGGWTTTYDNTLDWVSEGTSYAAPQVAGLAALIIAEKKAAGESWAPETIREEIIKKHTLDLDDPNRYCHGNDEGCRNYLREGFDIISGHGMVYIYELFGAGGVDMAPAREEGELFWTINPPVGIPVVVKIGPNGQVIPIWSDAPLVHPLDLEVLPNGDVLVVDHGYPRNLSHIEDGAVYRLTGDYSTSAEGANLVLELLSGNKTAIPVKPNCFQINVYDEQGNMTSNKDYCEYDPASQTDPNMRQSHGMVDPFNIAVDENGAFFILDKYTNWTNNAPVQGSSVFQTSLFHFNATGAYQGSKRLHIPDPRPWTQPENILYDVWSEKGAYMAGEGDIQAWMTYSRPWKEKYGGTGLVFTYTTGFRCIDPSKETCKPPLNGAVLSLKNLGDETLELLTHASDEMPWTYLWSPVGDLEGNISFGTETMPSEGLPPDLRYEQIITQSGFVSTQLLPNVEHFFSCPAFDKDGNLFIRAPDRLHFYKRNSDGSSTDFSESEIVEIKLQSTSETIVLPIWAIATLGHPE